METFAEIIKNITECNHDDDDNENEEKIKYICISFVGENYKNNNNNNEKNHQVKIDFIRSYLIDTNDVNNTLVQIEKEKKDTEKNNAMYKIKEEAKKSF